MSHCVYSWQGSWHLLSRRFVSVFVGTWSKAYEEDLEEETIEYYMIYTVWSKPESYGSRVILATADEAEARFRFHLIRTVSEIYFSGAAIAEHRDGIRISKGDAKLYYVMKTVQVENL